MQWSTNQCSVSWMQPPGATPPQAKHSAASDYPSRNRRNATPAYWQAAAAITSAWKSSW
jgi:hypothetical protein